MSPTKLTLEVCTENLRLKEPFRISGYTFNESPVTLVTLREGSFECRGVAAGVFYLTDTPDTMHPPVEGQRAALGSGPAGGGLRA